MRTPSYLAKVILKAIQNPAFNTLLPDDETKSRFIEQVIREDDDFFGKNPNPLVPSKAEFESFFVVENKQETVKIKQPLPPVYFEQMLDIAMTLLTPQKHSFEMRLNAVKVDFEIVWTGFGDGLSDDCIEVNNIKISPATKIGKYARALGKFVDWDHPDLIKLAADRILKSKYFKTLRLDIRNFLLGVQDLKTIYQFDLEHDIIEAAQKPYVLESFPVKTQLTIVPKPSAAYVENTNP